jgi:hypothetical protein
MGQCLGEVPWDSERTNSPPCLATPTGRWDRWDRWDSVHRLAGKSGVGLEE